MHLLLPSKPELYWSNFSAIALGNFLCLLGTCTGTVPDVKQYEGLCVDTNNSFCNAFLHCLLSFQLLTWFQALQVLMLGIVLVCFFQSLLTWKAVFIFTLNALLLSLNKGRLNVKCMDMHKFILPIKYSRNVWVLIWLLSWSLPNVYKGPKLTRFLSHSYLEAV